MVKENLLSRAVRNALILGAAAFVLSACSGDDGDRGPQGDTGAQGTKGDTGDQGVQGDTGDRGPAGDNGNDGQNGASSLTVVKALDAAGVSPCLNGLVLTQTGLDTNANNVLDADEVTSSVTSCGTTQRSAPMSSLVANYRTDGASNIPDYVKGLVQTYATTGTSPMAGFPLGNFITDSVRTIQGLSHNVVTQWLDPLSTDPNGPVFGSNSDYTAYFGDDWNSDWADGVVGSAPQFNGSARSGWVWVNHEYISDGIPAAGSAPTGQNLSYAQAGLARGVFDFDVTEDAAWTQERVDAYIDWAKKTHGGSWLRVIQRDNGEWTTELSDGARRYDSTSNTLSTVTGFTLSEADINDAGEALPANQVAGIIGDCSGGQTPWGTILTAEENVQFYFGDLEDGWSSRQTFDPTGGWGPGSPVTINYSPVAAGEGSFAKSNADLNHNREVYGFLTEIDPGVDSNVPYTSAAVEGGNGVGHRKIGSMGRARWENATLVTDGEWELENGKPVVIYGGNDRRSGRIYKWVSDANYTDGMTKAQVRALLDTGSLYVAHFADMDTRTGYTLAPADGSACANADVWESGADTKRDVFDAGCASPTAAAPGNGVWIELSTTSTDIAPNAATLGANTTVGAALQNDTWNSIGGFPDDNTVLSALFTASMKIGVMELNRPEDVEWNPTDGNLYIAFTSHGRPYALDQNGVMKNGGTGGVGGEEERRDDEGAIFVLREADTANPGTSDTFTFWAAWQGERGNCEFCAENPDNIMIDDDGGVWFGTDGNFSDTRGTVDSLYYLDLNPARAAGQPGVMFETFGKPFRVISGPSNSEATGPAFNSDMTTIFFNVQHPGEGSEVSNWPNG